jgi:threonine synthase
MKSLEENGKYELTKEELEKIKEDFIATSCSDEEGFEYIREYAKKGYIMDTHTATALKAYKTLNSKNKQVAYSTAEWTKFAPSLYRALIEDKKVSDLEALNEINKKYNAPIPKMIKELFNKPISQTTVVEKDEIEKEIVEFL